jgi:mannose-1-phosphate guanylyltransferase/phosphomannomutase
VKAVVMAGGEGSRLRPLTVGRPKPMVPIVNKAVMGHILDLLRSHGITDIIVTLRYMAGSIQDYFDDGSSYGVKLTYVVEETPLGTAGSVKNAAHLLSDAPFLIISGDAMTDFDLKQILTAHREREAKATITLTRVPNPSEYGIVVNDDQGWVRRFVEKPGWGDIISDTVNTGIYVLEPDVLDMIPANTSYDFSNDLFPAMLKRHMPLSGYVTEGYWCDIGTIAEYIRANADALHGRIKLAEPIGEHLGGAVFVSKDVDIAPSAQLFGPIYLGNGVKIKDNVRIYGPAVVRDYTVVDNYTLIERSIIWRNNYIGESCEVRGAVIVRECSLKPKVMIFEGAVIGDNCVLGEGCVIHPDVKLWPKKEIEAGTVVKDSIIWGNQARRSLFGRFGVSGVVNVELTPEYAAKLSASLGATLPKDSSVAINRDSNRSSRMLKRALISGLPGTGVNVWDLGTVPIPVLRHFVREHEDTTAGMHVRISPFDQRVVDIRMFDKQGMNPSTADERAIERNFFREDFRRAYLDDIGTINYAHEPEQAYLEAFLQHVDADKIRQAGFHLVVDYSNGLAAETMARIFNKLGIDVVALNSRTDESKLAMLQDEFRANQVRMGKIVAALNSTVGVQLDVGGEKIFLVDETGVVIDDIVASALMLEIALYAHPRQPVAVPIHMPNAFDTIAGWHDAPLTRIGQSMLSLMNAANERNQLLVCDGTGNFIFPDFLPAVDGMMATVRLLQYLALRNMSVSEIVRYLPPIQMAKGSIHCPWDLKGSVMRQLHEQFKNNHVETIDGIKIHSPNGSWVHISPHPDRPTFEVVTEANAKQVAEEMVQQAIQQVERLRDAG